VGIAHELTLLVTDRRLWTSTAGGFVFCADGNMPNVPFNRLSLSRVLS